MNHTQHYIEVGCIFACIKTNLLQKCTVPVTLPSGEFDISRIDIGKDSDRRSSSGSFLLFTFKVRMIVIVNLQMLNTTAISLMDCSQHFANLSCQCSGPDASVLTYYQCTSLLHYSMHELCYHRSSQAATVSTLLP